MSTYVDDEGGTDVGFLDDAKKKLGLAVDKHGDKIGEGLDKAGDLVDKKTGGKHRDKIASGVERTKHALDGLDGRNDDIPRASTPTPEPGGDPSEGDQPTGPTGPSDPTEPTDPSEPTAPTGPMGTGVPGGGGHRPETDPSSSVGSGGEENADPQPVPTNPAPVPPEPGADPAEDTSRPGTGGAA